MFGNSTSSRGGAVAVEVDLGDDVRNAPSVPRQLKGRVGDETEMEWDVRFDIEERLVHDEPFLLAEAGVVDSHDATAGGESLIVATARDDYASDVSLIARHQGHVHQHRVRLGAVVGCLAGVDLFETEDSSEILEACKARAIRRAETGVGPDNQVREVYVLAGARRALGAAGVAAVPVEQQHRIRDSEIPERGRLVIAPEIHCNLAVHPFWNHHSLGEAHGTGRREVKVHRGERGVEVAPRDEILRCESGERREGLEPAEEADDIVTGSEQIVEASP